MHFVSHLRYGCHGLNMALTFKIILAIGNIRDDLPSISYLHPLYDIYDICTVYSIFSAMKYSFVF